MTSNPYIPPPGFEDGSGPESVPRPLGVWFVTLWTGLFAGLLPLAALGFFLFVADVAPVVLTRTQIAIAVLLGLGIIASSVGAWRGSSTASYVLVVLVLIHYGWVAWQNYQLGEAGIIHGGALRAVGRATTGILIAAYLLLSRKASAFFHQEPHSG